MADTDCTRIRPLDHSSDYALRYIRVEAPCSSKGLDDVLETLVCAEDSDLAKKDFKNRQRKTKNVIESAFTERPLRIVRTAIADPPLVLEKLDARYDAKNTA